MRASKTAKNSAQGARTRNAEIHVSGAEGLYDFAEIKKTVKTYLLRAMSHPRGEPGKIVITLEKIGQRPAAIPCLPFFTVSCTSPDEAGKIIGNLLSDMGISGKAIRKGIRAVTGRSAMQGAALMLNESGIRVEPDKKRGVRVSRLGMRKDAGRHLSRRLSKKGINTTTVKEALILASKVASCRGVAGELCVSDDPDYTTGYVASRELGYVRIPNIKKKGRSSGGRVFFIDEGADVERVVEYLERKPVLVGK